jgi:hypothetical protein
VKKTEWYPPHIKPVHCGIYEVTTGSAYIFKAYWDGEKFRDPDTGGRYVNVIFYWRGLTEEAK